ncbi:hypothetical protein N9334_00270 [Luminiphilus sp.]|nr:hypothetical protein [Luminiphilus sp.]
MTVRFFFGEVIDGVAFIFVALWDFAVGVLSVVFSPFDVLDAELAHALGAVSIYAYAFLLFRTAKYDRPEDSIVDKVTQIVCACSGSAGLGLAFYEVGLKL